MRKYRANFKHKMTFHSVIFNFNTDSKYITFSSNATINSDQLFETRIVSLNSFGEIFIDGKFDDTMKYQDLIKLDWYEVYQIPEVQKPPIDPNRKIAKGGNSEVVSKLFIAGEDVTEVFRQVCREEIAKENKTRYVFPNMKAQDQAYNLRVLEELNKTIKLAKTIKKKKQKQDFDGDKQIFISKDNTMLACLQKDSYQGMTYRIATQAEINSFFKGTKKRYKIIKCTTYECYDKGNFRYFNYFTRGKFVRQDLKTSYKFIITEAEYLENIK